MGTVKVVVVMVAWAVWVGVPPPPTNGGLAGAGGDRAGRRILLSGLGGTFGRVGSVGAV